MSSREPSTLSWLGGADPEASAEAEEEYYPEGQHDGEGFDTGLPAHKALADLEGYWLDIVQPRKQYAIQGNWCGVLRNYALTNQRHKLVLDGSTIYWGISKNFYMEWRDDSTITWFSGSDDKEKFSWKRISDAAWPKGLPKPLSASAKGKGKAKRPATVAYAKPSGWGPDAWSVDTASSWYDTSSYSAAIGKGRGKSKGRAKGQGKASGKGYNSWQVPGWGSDWGASDAYDWWSQAQPHRWAGDDKPKKGKDIDGGALLESVVRLVRSAPDGLNISFLGTKFAPAFNQQVRKGEGRNDGSFKAWLQASGRFVFTPHDEHKSLCLVALKEQGPGR
mmetsp:Transcript_63666/g.171144  ORF Transcript_63666/g.171144 Transcript_63666/m.171144 type:complete len:334 (-) Transcript_63666:218-1219(-)